MARRSGSQARTSWSTGSWFVITSASPTRTARTWGTKRQPRLSSRTSAGAAGDGAGGTGGAPGAVSSQTAAARTPAVAGETASASDRSPEA